MVVKKLDCLYGYRSIVKARDKRVSYDQLTRCLCCIFVAHHHHHHHHHHYQRHHHHFIRSLTKIQLQYKKDMVAEHNTPG